MGLDRVHGIVQEGFARTMGIEFVESEPNRVVLRLPYGPHLGVGRIHGGAISAFVDTAATAAFWSLPDPPPNARGATIGFTIHYLRLAVGIDLTATATVRRRGGTISVGEVCVTGADGAEIATATVTYKLDAGKR